MCIHTRSARDLLAPSIALSIGMCVSNSDAMREQAFNCLHMAKITRLSAKMHARAMHRRRQRQTARFLVRETREWLSAAKRREGN